MYLRLFYTLSGCPVGCGLPPENHPQNPAVQIQDIKWNCF